MGGGGEYTKKDIKKNGESGDGRHRESNERGEMVGEETKRKTEREGGREGGGGEERRGFEG